MKIKASSVALLLVSGCVAEDRHPEPPALSQQVALESAVDPIARIGHGSMFDAAGKELTPTPELLAQAQAFYVSRLRARLSPDQAKQYADDEAKVYSALKLVKNATQQEQLVVDSARIDLLLRYVAPDDGGALKGKNNLIKSELRQRLFAPGIGESYKVPSPLDQALPPDIQVLSATMNSGAAYLAECSAAGVPTPPDWNPTGGAWRPTSAPRTIGAVTVAAGGLFNSEEFISRSREARVYVYKSASPEGACIALPRVLGSTIKLLGIICMGKVSGKACFWDNQESDVGYDIPWGATVPIESSTVRDFAGGAELLGGTGGICTGCHAGENAFILHPGTPLGHPALDSTAYGALPTMPDVWFDPLVHGDWPQNLGPGTLASRPEATRCVGCHSSPVTGGRFPKLSWALISDIGVPGYCEDVLKNAININPLDPVNTMPQGGVLTPAEHTSLVTVIDDFCDGDPANAEGDPHLTTIDGVRYDLQGDGEFVMLKGTDFEVQARQSAAATEFMLGPQQYTDLTSCVSLTSAVATQVGSHRVSYEPRVDGVPDPAGMELRIDGTLVALTPAGVTLSGGGRVARSAVGGLEIEYPNGEHLDAVSTFWGSEGKWYLNLSVAGAEANLGVLGSLPASSWLPRLPDGSDLGARPVLLTDRFSQLYSKFADSWRVDKTTSLFDYAPGTSTFDFTLPGWPSQRAPCEPPDLKALPSETLKVAQAVCQPVTNEGRRADCVVDVVATGEVGFADAYRRTEQLQRWGTSAAIEVIRVKGDVGGVAVKVRSRQPELNGVVKGSARLFIDGEPYKDLIPLDVEGRAAWVIKGMAWREHRVFAQYEPTPGSSFLPSFSPEVVPSTK